MKLLLTLFAVSCLLLFISCDKKIVYKETDLAGSWKLVKITGGFAGINETPSYDQRYIFQTNQSFTTTTNAVITNTGTYSLGPAPQPNYYISETVLNTISSNNQKNIYGIIIHNDSLILNEGCCDQFIYTYVKLK